MKEPRRLKKDPLTQTSISSFYSASQLAEMNGIKVKEERIDEDENNLHDYGKNIKSEPVDDSYSDETAQSGQVVGENAERNIKCEPNGDGFDSDAETEHGSDDEEANQTIGVPNIKKEPNTDIQFGSSAPVKSEPKNDIDSVSDAETEIGDYDGAYDNAYLPHEIRNIKTEKSNNDVERSTQASTSDAMRRARSPIRQQYKSEVVEEDDQNNDCETDYEDDHEFVSPIRKRAKTTAARSNGQNDEFMDVDINIDEIIEADMMRRGQNVENEPPAHVDEDHAEEIDVESQRMMMFERRNNRYEMSEEEFEKRFEEMKELVRQ